MVIISASGPPLVMNADAPACAARVTHSPSWCAVTTATAVCGLASRRRRVATRPSVPGIWMSITTTDGASSRTRWIPSAADAAVPTHRIPGTASNAAASRSAKHRWSSTIRTVVSRPASLPRPPVVSSALPMMFDMCPPKNASSCPPPPEASALRGRCSPGRRVLGEALQCVNSLSSNLTVK